MHDITCVPADFPPEDPETRAVVKKWLRMTAAEQKAWLWDGVSRKDPVVDRLMSGLYKPNPDPEDAARAMGHHLVERGQWGVLHGLIRHFADAEDLPADPTAAVLSELYGLRQLWNDPFRYRLMTQVIAYIEMQWDRPPGYEDTTFE